MLRALAEAEQSVVPVVKNRRVRGLRFGASARAVDVRKEGTGYKAYGAMAVRTTRTVRRGFERERNAERWRRKEFV